MPVEDFELPDDELDAMIESVLRDEPLLSAPMNFHRRVEERVRLCALKDYEVARFRYSMVSLMAAFFGAIGLAAAVVVFTNFETILANGLPGGNGTYDRYTVSMWQSWSSYSGAYLFVTTLGLGLGAVLLALLPLRKYLRTP